MLWNVLVGCATMAVCLSIQCIAISILLSVLIAFEKKSLIKPTLVSTSLLLITLMLITLAGNLVQMAIWAGLFIWRGEFETFDDAFYHSIVNFTTLGYGDVVMQKGNRLLGALEAANGVLMFGLTTGFLFTILSRIVQQEWNQHLLESSDESKEARGQ